MQICSMLGFNTFPLINVRGTPEISNQWRMESLLYVSDERIIFKPSGAFGPSVDFAYEDIGEC